jgi:hypothetical protein
MPSSKKNNIKCWVPINKCIIQTVKPDIKSADLNLGLDNVPVPINISKFYTNQDLNNVGLIQTENVDMYISRLNDNSPTLYSVTTNIQRDSSTQNEFYLILYYIYFDDENCIEKRKTKSSPPINGNFTNTEIINFDDIKDLSNDTCTNPVGFMYEISDSTELVQDKEIKTFRGTLQQQIKYA